MDWIADLQVDDVNPEPWTAPAAVRGPGGKVLAIKGGRNEVYQRALVEAVFELLDNSPRQLEEGPEDAPLAVHFFFWRSTTGGNRADATNLQKATEDALQGVLYANDRDNATVGSTLVEQGPDVAPRIVIRIGSAGHPRICPQVPGLVERDPELERSQDMAWRETYEVDF